MNIEDLDLPGRRVPVKAKGAAARRRRGRAREDFVLETVYWDAGTARLLPRLLRAAPAGRCSSPTAAPARGRSSPRATCARTPGWPGCRTARPAPCWTSTRPSARAGHGLGPARIPAFRPDPPRRGRAPAADADGQVPAQEAGERPPLLPALAGGDRRGHQLARARQQQPMTPHTSRRSHRIRSRRSRRLGGDMDMAAAEQLVQENIRERFARVAHLFPMTCRWPARPGDWSRMVPTRSTKISHRGCHATATMFSLTGR